MPNDSNRLAIELAQYTSANARAEAEAIAASLPASAAASPKAASSVAQSAAANRVLQQHETTLQGGFAFIYREGHSIASFHTPQSAAGTPQGKTWLSEPASVDEDGQPTAA